MSNIIWQVTEYQDKLTAAETEIAELKNKMDDLEYNFEKADERAARLDRHLAEALQKLHQILHYVSSLQNENLNLLVRIKFLKIYFYIYI
jgi:chromosome segregation ATPase